MKRLTRSIPVLALLSLLSPFAQLYADPVQLTKEDVETIIANAASEAARIDPRAIIAVTDRDGFVLAVWDMGGRIPNPVPPFSFDPGRVALYGKFTAAITRAGTAAFLSSDQEAFTSRTAGFIIQQHFPPGVRNTGNGPLVGVGLSSLFFSDVNFMKYIPNGFDPTALVDQKTSPGVRAPSVLLGSLNDSPGGVPLYRLGHLVGGIGVTGDGSPTDLTPAAAIFLKDTQTEATTGFKEGRDRDEIVALAGQTGFRPRSSIVANNVLINGIRIPYVRERFHEIEDVHDPKPLGTFGQPVRGLTISFNGTNQVIDLDPKASPQPYPWERRTFGDYGGEVRFTLRDDPLLNHPTRSKVRGVARRLSRPEVEAIIEQSAHRALTTRAGIRLPLGSAAHVFITVVANPDKAGEKPEILGVFRTGEATIFSWDVAVQKARTAIFFSNSQLAMSSRSVGFLAQKFYPPGIDGREHGPLFGFQEAVSLRQAPRGGFPGNPNLPNGITIFPGGFPLYRNGKVIGAVGISGDGVDQDDIIGISGTRYHRPAPEIRADQFTYRGARLPYVKFPRDPER
ncbi:MAG: heme-binding protein [Chthoniobacteraceae bacterium]